MTLDDLLTRLGLAASRDLFAPHAEDDLAAVPGRPGCLDGDAAAAAAAFVGLPDRYAAPLRAMAERVYAEAGLRAFAWHLTRLLFDHLDYPAAQVLQWPTLETALGDDCGLFYLLVGLDYLPRMREVHRRLGVPAAVTDQCATSFSHSQEIYEDTHGGRLGVHPRMLYWLRHSTSGDLYRVGRLEYMLRPLPRYLEVFRCRADGRLLALAAGGLRLDTQGFIARADEEALTTVREDDERGAVGHPVQPNGRALREPLRLPAAAWERVLAPGDPVLEIHIPAGGGMTPERCEQSMRDALAFYRQVWPERPVRAWGCTSWILNPELAEWYSPTANMVRWQEQLYLYPIASSGRDGLYFTFGEDQPPVERMRTDTSLRRAFRDHLAAGGRLRAGGGFMLVEDLDRYGRGGYRGDWSLDGTEAI